MLEYLTQFFDVTLLYYNPNIQPQAEYEKRLEHQRAVLRYIPAEIMECDYDGAAFEAVRHNIPAIAISAAGDKYLPEAEKHLFPILRELAEQQADPGSVWNVNFPVMKEGRPLRGILRDRRVCPVSMYQERYLPVLHEEDSVVLECRGIPTPDAMIPEGTDAAAVRAGYISIGQVANLTDGGMCS